MEKLAIFPVFALGAGLALNAMTFGGQDAQAEVQTVANEEVAPDIIAVQVRKQGYECKNPSRAERDPKASSPDLPVWILTCENAKYHVRLVGNMADRIDRL